MFSELNQLRHCYWGLSIIIPSLEFKYELVPLVHRSNFPLKFRGDVSKLVTRMKRVRFCRKVERLL